MKSLDFGKWKNPIKCDFDQRQLGKQNSEVVNRPDTFSLLGKRQSETKADVLEQQTNASTIKSQTEDPPTFNSFKCKVVVVEKKSEEQEEQICKANEVITTQSDPENQTEEEPNPKPKTVIVDGVKKYLCPIADCDMQFIKF